MLFLLGSPAKIVESDSPPADRGMCIVAVDLNVLLRGEEPWDQHMTQQAPQVQLMDCSKPSKSYHPLAQSTLWMTFMQRQIGWLTF
jgi:hypothetical protein